MKKTLLLIAFCLISTTLFGQKIRIFNGSITPIADEIEISAVFTYDNLQVGKLREIDYVERKVADYNEDEEGKGDIWRENWINDRKERYEPKFFELFDKYMADKSKRGGFVLIPDDGQTKYVFHINTYFIEPGYNVAIVRRNASITLDVEIVERETGEKIARIVVEDASANSFSGLDFDTGYRIQECYAKAGREFAKFLIKKLKL